MTRTTPRAVAREADLDDHGDATPSSTSMTTPPRFPAWDLRYQDQPVETMPWFYPHLDPDLAQALDRLGINSGKALDLGTGPGTQAIALAKRGLDVTGSDLSSAAVAGAQRLAASEGVDVRFLEDDILASRISETFDLVFDRGCFHVIDPEARPDYVQKLHQLIGLNGYLFVKTFSIKQPGTQGPHRFSPDDIRAVFEPVFNVESITETVYQGTLDPLPFALFCVLRRR
jgi:2-polyprenyl-3-methyl-5-hydroxy-6-metoxy-1,4-benzoquinol methylase